MFLLHQDARYIDLLNACLQRIHAGVSAKGIDSSIRPLTLYGSYERFDWINTPCCPPNVVPLLASLGDYIYAQGRNGNDVYVNLFIAGRGLSARRY